MVKETTTAPEFNYNSSYSPSFEELYNLYMKMDKEDLARLLAAKELVGKQQVPQFVPMPYYPPINVPQYPYITWNITC